MLIICLFKLVYQGHCQLDIAEPFGQDKIEYIKLCPEKFWQPRSSSTVVEEAKVILYNLTYAKL